jgi:hypothetical protein
MVAYILETTDCVTAFVFDSLVLFESHPETHAAVLEKIGSRAILLVETNRGKFCKWQVDPDDLDKILYALPPGRILFSGDSKPWLTQQVGEVDLPCGDPCPHQGYQ